MSYVDIMGIQYDKSSGVSPVDMDDHCFWGIPSSGKACYNMYRTGVYLHN